MSMEKGSYYEMLQVRRTRLCEQIADQIQELIIANKLQPGDRLPAERELADMLGVSRPTVREATKVLQDRGLVELKPGSGTYVMELNIGSITESIERFFIRENSPYHELQQIREIFEPEIAALAAIHAGPDTISKMEEAITEMEVNIHSAEQYAKADLQFHLSLVEATRNRMLLALFNPIVDIMQDSIREVTSRQMKVDTPKGPQHHREILEHIKGGRAAEAKAAMQIHLSYTREDLKRVFQDRRKEREGK